MGDGVKILSIVFFLGRGWDTQAYKFGGCWGREGGRIFQNVFIVVAACFVLLV